MRFWKSAGVAALGSDVLSLVRARVRTTAVGSEARRPFRFFLCGDPALVSELRVTLLRGHDDSHIPLDAAATLETIDPLRRPTVMSPDARCVIFLGRPGDAAGARLDLLTQLKLPVFVLTVDPNAPAAGSMTAPHPGEIAEHHVTALDREALRTRFFPPLIDCCRGIEIAVGRRLPALRETVGVKLTRDAARSALKVAIASAVVDNVPFLGVVLGAMASAGDTVAITAIQIVLLMQIGAAYGKDPDMQRTWEMLPVLGGGFGWRMLARELSGFIPVAGVAIKGAIAYAGTIVVGEGVTFYYEHGRHMTKADAAVLYEEARHNAIATARDVLNRLRKRR
ncbi:MAG TPA: hypothetical protein VME66_00230 [Candidatus Acidoferrales bacterium]|nr:hypothetical protein [Candidatus Acidoferrales bacterium]